jgi:hypothetical protein
MRTVLIVLIYVLSGAAMLTVNYVIWFIILPVQFRQMRDILRRIRARRKSN